MLSRPLDYVVVVSKLWGKQISGPILAVVAIGLTLTAAYYSNDPSAASWILKFSAWVTGIAAIMLIFVAQYNAWKAERDALHLEFAKNQKPEIKGKAHHFRLAEHGTIAHNHDLSDDTWTTELPFDFTLSLANHRQATTNLEDLLIDTTAIRPSVSVWRLDYCRFYVLEYAKGASLLVSGRASIQAGPQEERVNLDLLRVSVVDGLGGHHKIEVPLGQSLPLNSYS